MTNFKKYLFQVTATVGFFLFVSFSNTFPERPKTGFWAMEGKLITHYFEEKTDSLSGPELFELQDKNGLPIWFGRHIFKDVCISGECKMIRLWLFWDGTGSYLGMQIPDGEPLTKSDHTEFQQEDYVKLEGILRDTASILKALKQEDLIIVPDSIDPYEVDGYTAATQPTLAEVVVKDAVYSCHTLWHTVYGPVQNEINTVLENNLSEKFLANMFASQNQGYISRAIKCVAAHPEYHSAFYPEIMHLVKSDNSALANQALSYFRPEILADTVIQQQLVLVMADTYMNMKYEILWKFIGLGKVNEQVVLELLNMFTSQEMGVGTYNLILRLVTPEHISGNEQIARILSTLSQDENGYVRNLTKKILNKEQ
ncbi:hypothetical protein SAMN05444274_105164 [Mariniphaga anaerophila]|uniref:Uncharacterized protein n=1 Tax=Mariniphaga anaerophila TaxID=1484053 RepID=A0A1M5BIM3_9BACT|nr:hypothetical protein [Mariniphaga anaerophila]SHF42315.1 hypothetical protein SAMN05444274_105164 [Mariniphaga anaerophila]